MLTSGEIRSSFIELFAEQYAHTIWPSSKVILPNDPTLLFVNAGMNQFKDIFTGDLDASSTLIHLKRAVNSQKCIRAGGKHNDLDDVGRDGYHHTFFEMLGSWSFGDYFKAEAIEWAWELLTKIWKIPEHRLYVTYFNGDEQMHSIPPDLDSKNLWLRYLPESHILPFDAKDNFWEMGETGPCGPCSEIHYDRRGGRDAAYLVNCDDPDVIEIWNLVFMQYNRQIDGTLRPLPYPCVDTGMGLERIVSVLQGAENNYGTDLFRGIFEELSRILVMTTSHSLNDITKQDTARRVIADHIRTLTVAIADGVIPSNEGAGYVLRRILRRALRFGFQFLNASQQDPWLYLLVPAVISILGGAFPELSEKQNQIEFLIKKEEQLFSKTLSKGVILFKRVTDKLKRMAETDQAATSDKLVIPGHVAFELYSTYGFPLDLIEVMATEIGFQVDTRGYQEAFERHRKASENPAFKGPSITILSPLSSEKLHFLENELSLPPTDDSWKYQWTPDRGEGLSLHSHILAGWNGEEFITTGFIKAEMGNEVLALLLDKTTFFSEAGGQAADKGLITWEKNGTFNVVDVKKVGCYVFHVGTFETLSNDLEIGMEVLLRVDYARRLCIAQNHTSTHALGSVMRVVTNVMNDNKGTEVRPDKGRYDYVADQGLPDEALSRIEEEMRKIIASQLPVYVESVKLQQAMTIPGKCAQFGERYPNVVRVVSIGAEIKDLLTGITNGYEYSVEFCGGTHLHNSKDIKEFVIISEESVSKGVRRLLFVSGQSAVEALQRSSELTSRLESIITHPITEEIEAQFSVLCSELNDKAIVIPQTARRALREKANKYAQEKIARQQKKQRAPKKDVQKFVEYIMSKLKNDEQYHLEVLEVENQVPFLVVSTAMTSLKKECRIPIMILQKSSSVAINVCCIIPKFFKSFTALEWASAVLQKPASGNALYAIGDVSENAIHVLEDLAYKFVEQKF